MEGTGSWSFVVDDSWRIVYVTEATRWTYGGNVERAGFAIGCHFFGPEMLAASRTWRFGPNTPERVGLVLEAVGGWVVEDAPGGLAEVRQALDPSVRPVLDHLRPVDDAATWLVGEGAGLDRPLAAPIAVLRVRRRDGSLAGSVLITEPALSMEVLSYVTMADPSHATLMHRVAKAARRPAAILFGDLEGSSALGRRMPTSTYFSLGRRLVSAADKCVIAHGGLVGRHVGDGIVAFFLVEAAGSESAAARGCIAAARRLRAELPEIAVASGLDSGELSLRFGLHWGATLYVGSITTPGRSEVTALGDEVNEGARIEACATDGRILASKDLVERLDSVDGEALEIDAARITYTLVQELQGATEKARRDAPAIPVCEL
jgi:class 3 adenylate cyclase